VTSKEHDQLQRALESIESLHYELIGWSATYPKVSEKTERHIAELKAFIEEKPLPDAVLSRHQEKLVNQSLAQLAINLQGSQDSAKKLAYARRALIDELRLIPKQPSWISRFLLRPAFSFFCRVIASLRNGGGSF
jgi:hypothetical protein